MPQYVITTAAGTGSPGSGGDGGAATSAAFKYLSGLAMDAFENLYVADPYDCKIRMVTSAGIIQTFAGTGMSGNGGDGGMATNTSLSNPSAVAVDVLRGSVYIADTGNGKIRVVNNNTGIMTTFAGTYYSSYNTYDCAATSAHLVNPAAVAVDSVGNVYVGTGNPYGSNNFQVLVVAHSTGFITLVAGTGAYGSPLSYGGPATSALLNAPTGIAVDSSLNVYIATASQYQSYNQVLVVTHSTGMISVFAGVGSYSYVPNNGDGGPAINAILNYPSGIVVDKDDNVYISDQGYNTVRVVTNGAGIITTLTGGHYSGAPSLGDGGLASSASLSYPGGLAVDRKGDNIYIADRYNYRVRKVTKKFNYPTSQPTQQPTTLPSRPSSQPSMQPSNEPSGQPSLQPSTLPTTRPSMLPSNQPSGEPTKFVWHPKPQVCLLYCMP